MKDSKNSTQINLRQQNSIRHRILACISLCDNIFRDARNEVFLGKIKNDFDQSRDFFGTDYSINFLQNPDNTTIKTAFLEELNNKYLIDVNEENFEDIFVKINVLRNWLIHYDLKEAENIKQESSEGNNQNNQKPIEEKKTKKKKRILRKKKQKKKKKKQNLL